MPFLEVKNLCWIHFGVWILACNDNMRLSWQKLLNHQTTWRFRQQEANSKRSFNSSLEGTQPDVWCEKTPRQSEGVQNSRLTLSHWALWTLSHNSSPAVISSSSLPCHPFFSTLKTVSCWRERLETRGQSATLAKRVRYSQNLHLLDTVICWTGFESDKFFECGRLINGKFWLEWEFGKPLDLTPFGGVWAWL